MREHRVAVIPGDGIGPEVITEGLGVLSAAGERFGTLAPAAAVLVLRKKRPDLVRPYHTAGYPFVPVLFILGASVLLFSTLFDRPRESFMGIGLILLGLPFYFYWKKRRQDVALPPAPPRR